MGLPALLSFSSLLALASSAVVSLLSTTPVNTLNAQYASYNIDSSCNRGFHQINFTNANLAAAGLGLSPARLRFGGSGNDNLVYGLTQGSPECNGVVANGCDYVTPGCLNGTQWSNLFALSQAAEADFIFGVSFGLAQACAEGATYIWNSSNAATLLTHLVSFNQSVWGFELGNEVNNNGGPPCNLQPQQQADAFKTWAGMVAAALPGAVLIGPDTGYRDALSWLDALLPALPPGLLHGVTHHVYNDITRSNFNSPSQLDSSLPEIAWYTNATRSLYPSGQIWAGENGPIGGGDDGTCGVNTTCGTYATTLWYSDDMALRALHGFVQYQRQDLFGGAYGLTNSPTGAMALSAGDPVILRPDYWVNFLWKRLLGPKVYNVSSSSTTLRAYAFAGTPPSKFREVSCATASLQVLLLNIGTAPEHVVLPPPLSQSSGGNFSAWTLTSGGAAGDPFSLIAELNGAELPTTVDLGLINPASFLSAIVQPPVHGEVMDGVDVPQLSTTIVCY